MKLFFFPIWHIENDNSGRFNEINNLNNLASRVYYHADTDPHSCRQSIDMLPTHQQEHAAFSRSYITGVALGNCSRSYRQKKIPGIIKFGR